MSLSIRILYKTQENAVRRLGTHTTTQEHDINEFSHQEWIFEVVRIAQQDQQRVSKLSFDFMKNLRICPKISN
jgi:hypothetical protein